MTRKSKILVAAALLFGLLSAGIAYAAWTGNASGSGQASAISAVTVTVTATSGTADLYPGFAGGDLYFTLTNGNPYQITFNSMSAGTVTVDGAHSGCAVSNITVSPVASGLGLVSPSGTSGTLSIPNVVAMAAGAPDACQGAIFTVPVTLVGIQG